MPVLRESLERIKPSLFSVGRKPQRAREGQGFPGGLTEGLSFVLRTRTRISCSQSAAISTCPTDGKWAPKANEHVYHSRMRIGVSETQGKQLMNKEKSAPGSGSLP